MASQHINTPRSGVASEFFWGKFEMEFDNQYLFEPIRHEK